VLFGREVGQLSGQQVADLAAIAAPHHPLIQPPQVVAAAMARQPWFLGAIAGRII